MNQFINWWNNLKPENQQAIQVAIISAIVTAFITVFIPKIIWPILSRFIIKQKEIIYRKIAGMVLFNWWGIKRYRKSFQTKVERIANPWSSQKLLLLDIFVPIKVQSDFLLPHIVARQSISDNLVNLRTVATQYKCFVLVGQPGAGKSTALKSLGLAALRGTLYDEDNVIPIFVELRRYGESELNLESYLVSIFEQFDFPKSDNFINRILLRGKALILFDALDEVSETYSSKVIENILVFRNKYPNNRIIITSRIATYDRQFDVISDVTVALSDFNDIQIATFLRRWQFPSDKSSVQLMQILQQRPRILALCRNPLMLTIVTSLYVETDYELPQSRAEFYETCVEAVLKRWDSSRRIERYNKYKASIKRHILYRLGLHLQLRNDSSGDIELSELIRYVADILPKVGGISSEHAEELILEIIKNSGLLIYVGPQSLRFAHLTFQEFFAAREINATGDLGLLIDNFHRDPSRWREVCLLYAGISSRSNDLISALSFEHLNMAASCIAEGENIDIELAHQVLDTLSVRLANSQTIMQDLESISLMAADQNRLWFRDALTILLNFLHTTTDEIKIQAAITALANIPSPEAANELVASLLQQETKEVAEAALVKLGPVGLPAIRRVLQSSHEPEVQKTCIRICAQISTPDVIDVLLPWLSTASDADSLIQAEAAWAFAKLIQVQTIEQALQLMNAAEILPDRKLNTSPFVELSKWVWPFNNETDQVMRRLATLVVANLSPQVVSEFARRDGIGNRIDIRLAIPLSIQLYEHFSNRLSSQENNIEQAIGILLVGDEQASFYYRKQPLPLPLPYSPSPRISLSDIFTKKPELLRNAWANLLNKTDRVDSYSFINTRNISRVMGVFLLMVGVMTNIYSISYLININLLSIINEMKILIGVLVLGYLWKERVGQEFYKTILIPILGSYVCVKDIVTANWRGIWDLFILVGNVGLTIGWCMLVSIGLELLFGFPLGVVISITLFLLGNLLFYLNWSVEQDSNVWQRFFPYLSPGTLIGHTFSFPTGIKPPVKPVAIKRSYSDSKSIDNDTTQV